MCFFFVVSRCGAQTASPFLKLGGCHSLVVEHGRLLDVAISNRRSKSIGTLISNIEIANTHYQQTCRH